MFLAASFVPGTLTFHLLSSVHLLLFVLVALFSQGSGSRRVYRGEVAQGGRGKELVRHANEDAKKKSEKEKGRGVGGEGSRTDTAAVDESREELADRVAN